MLGFDECACANALQAIAQLRRFCAVQAMVCAIALQAIAQFRQWHARLHFRLLHS